MYIGTCYCGIFHIIRCVGWVSIFGETFPIEGGFKSFVVLLAMKVQLRELVISTNLLHGNPAINKFHSDLSDFGTAQFCAVQDDEVVHLYGAV